MYQRILVPIDGSATAQRGLAEAIALARVTGGRLHLLHVVDERSFALGADGFSGMSVDLLALRREGGASILANAVAEVETAGLQVDGVLKDSLAGRVRDLVLAEAAEWPADLIVIGTHGRRGARRLFMGSDAEQVLRQASVPVLLVRQPAAMAPAS
jgi:nucleotide-binding universal stress UspA family protein